MRLLHVFAGPFPTVQGTQALVAQTCRLLARAGHEVHLLAYAHAGYQFPEAPPFALHRLADRPRFRGERSGPAWQRPLLDLALAARCRGLSRRLEPDLVQAHHYEALVAARLADPTGGRPLVFQQHALLEPELASYLPAAFGPLLRRCGRAADRWLPRLADAQLVLSGAMLAQIAERGLPVDAIEVLPPPADPPPPAPPARPRVAGDRVTAVYVGNLDGYQGLDALLDGLAAVAPAVRRRLAVEVVTASEATPLARRIARAGLGELVRIVPHGSPAAAFARLASADLCLVPRETPGGVPIKLVNALAAGCPTIVDPALADGLEHAAEVWCAPMRDPAAVADAVTRLVGDAALRERLAAGARRAAARRHDPRRYVERLERVYDRLVSTRAVALRTAPGTRA